MQWNDSDVARFESRVDRTGDCHLWTASTDRRGYGQFSVTNDGVNRKIKAHRFAYLSTHGPESIPNGLFVLHNCPDGDNPSCVNPAHLWLGTAVDNNADMWAKGRGMVGKSHWTRLHPDRVLRGDRHWIRLHPEAMAHGSARAFSKLTEADIPAIRHLITTGATYQEIGRQFGISSSLVYQIAKRKIWKHVA